jgi:hypothetical protein
MALTQVTRKSLVHVAPGLWSIKEIEMCFDVRSGAKRMQ